MTVLRPAIRPAKLEALSERLAGLGIREEDLCETFMAPGTKGGQKANKTSCCVRLRHVPTGIEVKCRKHREQSLNRYEARKLLADRMDELKNGNLSERGLRAEKLRKQKDRRRRRRRASAAAEGTIPSLRGD